jgi:hypothetical protein
MLLGVAVVGGEVFLDECMQLLGGGIAAGEVELAQGFYDSGIEREGLGVGVGEEEGLEKLTQLLNCWISRTTPTSPRHRLLNSKRLCRGATSAATPRNNYCSP